LPFDNIKEKEALTSFEELFVDLEEGFPFHLPF